MADLVRWEHELSVNNELIDSQHKKLVDILNELYTALNEKKDKEVLHGLLDDLILSIAEHFRTEEHFMVLAAYPLFNEHKREHDDLVRQALSLQTAYKSGKVQITNDVLDFLNIWLLKHIEGADKKFEGRI
jgi:hemerythrin